MKSAGYRFFKPHATSGSCFAVIEKRDVVRLYFYMGVVLKGFLSSELRILSPHFAKPNGAKIFRRLFSFQRLYRSIYFLLKHRAVFVFVFLSMPEFGVRNFSIILYSVLLLGINDTFFFNLRRLLPLKLAVLLLTLYTAIHFVVSTAVLSQQMAKCAPHTARRTRCVQRVGRAPQAHRCQNTNPCE